jgi:hypothetical protein
MIPSLATNVGLLVSVAVVLLTIAGELRERVVQARTLWIRPAVLGGVALALTFLSLRFAPHLVSVLAAYGATGIAIGALLGRLIARRTTIRAAANFGSIQVRGSALTIMIWLAFIAARLALRTVTPGIPILSLDSNVAATAAIATAFAVIAVSFRNAMLQRVSA